MAQTLRAPLVSAHVRPYRGQSSPSRLSGTVLRAALTTLAAAALCASGQCLAQPRNGQNPHQEKPVYPPSGLVTLANPSRAAILRHELQVSLDPATNHLRATDRICLLHVPGTAAANAFPFLLWSGLAVDSIAGDGVKLRVESLERMNPKDFWKRPQYDELEGYEKAKETRLWIEDRTAWPETLRVTISYSGTVMDSLRPPKAAYARSFEDTAGLIEPRGAYLAGSTFWIPSRPDEVFTFRLQADVPADWRAVSQGGLLAATAAAPASHPSGHPASATPATGGHTDIWDCPHPMDEVYLVAGPWRLTEKAFGTIKAQTFTYAQTDTSITRRYLEGTNEYLEMYGKLIGNYPFEKFALVENFWQTGFGMPSFTLLGDRVIRLPFILHTSYGHEILHNWWGNSVFVAADSGNWCEGLTTYGADYLYKVRESSEAARQYRLTALSGYLDYVSGKEDMPLTRFRERHDFATQAIGYSKSMMVIHQLYRQAGEEHFWEALRLFYRDNLWRRASWGDLLRSFQRTAGIDGRSFLHHWIERTGAPTVLVDSVSSRQTAGGWRVRAVIAQKLIPARGENEPYPLTVPVRLTWAGGDSTWQVPLSTWSTSWSVVVPMQPTALKVDPDFEMMRRIDSAEIPPTLSRVLGSDTVSVVIAAGLSPELTSAFRDLAQEWGKGQTLRVVKEDSLPELPWTPNAGTWYLGLGASARKHLDSLPEVRKEGNRWRIAGKEYSDSSGVLLTGNLDASGKKAWAILTVPDPSQVPVLGAKIPHYGKYSYLVFAGGKNIGQGVWTQINSPLIVDLEQVGGGAKSRRRSP